MSSPGKRFWIGLVVLGGSAVIALGDEVLEGPKNTALTHKAGNLKFEVIEEATPSEPQIQALIDQLAIPEDWEERKNIPDDRYRKAADKLLALQAVSLPTLIKCLSDQRGSGFPFTRTFRGGVGEACESLIRNVLEDLPAGYQNGFSRIGRDGKAHVRPCWRGGGIFEASGGLKRWLADHEGISSSAMQLECLAWAVKKERAIGVPDAESYFSYILPLEIQLLKRRASSGEEIRAELDRLSGIATSKDVGEIPRGLLPNHLALAATKIDKKLNPPPVASDAEATAIRGLIEQLHFQTSSKPAEFGIVPDPANSIAPALEDATSKENRRRSLRCRLAFDLLTDLKDLAFPLLLEHPEDKRLSPDFHGHLRESSVRISCYLIIRYQLEDYPQDYGRYGYQRKGRDGKSHVVPRYSECPFDMDKIQSWLKENESLSYPQKKVKALQWTLSLEKQIGACDADSYFENILPLEIRIIERRKEMGEDVVAELKRLQEVRDKRLIDAIPKETLQEEGTADEGSSQEE